MIRIIRASDEKSFDMFIMGHALYAEKGKDIVCAAVSALIQTLALSMDDLSSYYDIDETDDGMITHLGATGKNIMILCNAVMKGLKEIEKDYPDFLQVDDNRP